MSALLDLSTFALQVPVHRRLSSDWNPALVRRLVCGNWVRTLAWTSRSVLVLSAAAEIRG